MISYVLYTFLFLLLCTVLALVVGTVLGKALNPPAPDMRGWTHEQRMEYHAQAQATATRAIGGLIIWNTISDGGHNHEHTSEQPAGGHRDA